MPKFIEVLYSNFHPTQFLTMVFMASLDKLKLCLRIFVGIKKAECYPP